MNHSRINQNDFFYDDSNLFIQASAGTGKTYTLEQKYMHLITQENYPPESILVMTFTRQSSQEIRYRLLKQLTSIGLHFNSEQIQVYTIDGFFHYLFNQYYFLLSLPSPISHMSQWNENFWLSILEIYFSQSSIDPKVAALVYHYQNHYPSHTFHQFLNWFAQTLQHYYFFASNSNIKLLNKDQNSLSFQLHQANGVLLDFVQRHPQLQSTYTHKKITETLYHLIKKNHQKKWFSQKYQVLLIDEFQDTNTEQWDILSFLFRQAHQRKIVVGDPKQSLYSFRGADLNLYFQVKNHFCHTQDLLVNYRSCANMVHTINHIFSLIFSQQYQTSQAFPIQYHNLKANQGSTKYFQSHLSCLEWLCIDNISSKKSYLSSYCEKICHKIIDLLEWGALPASIAILTMNNADVACLAEKLNHYHLPFRWIKAHQYDLLWQRPEVKHVVSLIEFFNQQHQVFVRQNNHFFQLLLSQLFQFPLLLVYQLQQTEQDLCHEIYRAIWQLGYIWQHYGPLACWEKLYQFPQKLTQLAQKNAHWAHVLEQFWPKRHDSFLLSLDQTHQGKERYLVYQQIFEKLEQYFRQTHPNFYQILDFIQQSQNPNFYQKCQLIEADDLADPHQTVKINSDTQTLQVMTVHQSKGLQFDYVFFIPSLSFKAQSRKKTIFKDTQPYYFYQNNQKYMSWEDEEHSPYEKKQRQLEWENMKKIYYVALTRAVYRNYLPCIISAGKANKALPKTEFFDFSLMLAQQNPQMVETPFSDEQKTQTVPQDSLSSPSYEQLYEILNRSKKDYWHFSFVETDVIKVYSPKNQIVLDKAPLATLKQNHWEKHLNFCYSYSSLTEKNRDMTYQNESQQSVWQNDEQDWNDPLETESKLPAGTKFGQMIHDIIAKLYWEKACQAQFWQSLQTRQWLEGIINSYYKSDLESIDEWLDSIIDILSTLWTKSLFTANNEELFTFNQLKSGEIQREFDFLFCQKDNRYFHGIIDFICQYQGRYYLVDWKTNHLGGRKNYTLAHLEQAMKTHQYHWQANLYCLAIYHYLKQKNMDYEQHFGGMFYIFIRSLQWKQLSTYFIKPPLESLLKWGESIV